MLNSPTLVRLQAGVGIIRPVTTSYQNFGFLVVSGYRWLPEFRTQGGNAGNQNFGLTVITVYHCLPLFRTQGGYRLPLVTIIPDSGWLPVTAGYQDFELMVVTGYRWLPEFRTQSGYRLPLVTKI